MKKNKLLYIGHPKRIMAIDASTNSMAFSIFNEGKLYKFGKINFNGRHVYERAGDACKKLTQFLQNFDIDAVVIESAIYTNSQKTAINLAIVQGVIIGTAQMFGNRAVVSCSPVSWQNWIGNGRLKKEEKFAIKELYGHDRSYSFYKSKEREMRKTRTISKINMQFDLNVNDDDVADAIAIGWYSSNNWNKLTDEPKNIDNSGGKS